MQACVPQNLIRIGIAEAIADPAGSMRYFQQMCGKAVPERATSDRLHNACQLIGVFDSAMWSARGSNLRAPHFGDSIYVPATLADTGPHREMGTQVTSNSALPPSQITFQLGR
jgi:hypothetical protein